MAQRLSGSWLVYIGMQDRGRIDIHGRRSITTYQVLPQQWRLHQIAGVESVIGVA